MNHKPLNPSASIAVVVNDDATQLNVLSGLLRKIGLQPRAFTGAEAALAAMTADGEVAPALIVTDLYMPGLDGWRFCRLLRSPDYAAFNQIPILVVSATFSGDEASRIAADLGAEAFLPSPVDGPRFCQQVQAILGGTQVRHPLRVLIVDDNAPICELLEAVFGKNGYETATALTARAASAAFRQTAFDVAVLDYHLPDGSGDTLLSEFRTLRPDCVCLMITSDTGPELALDWMKKGAAAYLQKPFKPDYLIELCARARRERALLRVEDLLEVRTRELQESAEEYRTLFNHAGDAIFIHDAAARILAVNPLACERLGYTPAELMAMTIREVESPEDSSDTPGRLARLMSHGHLSFETVHRHKSGSPIATEVNSRRTTWKGQPAIISNCRDITERKKADKLIRESLREKEALLKEVHHRVKNNLQVITSLLRLEAERSRQNDTQSVLRDMQGRIQSMALLHESLYRSGTFAVVDLGTYLKKITTRAFRAQVASPATVRLKLDLLSVQVEMDQAMPCGLLVNELISNCLKHGFPDGRDGEVRVELHTVDGGPRLCLRVSDTGVGLPADLASKRDHSLGLQLVSDLVGQIDGRLTLGPGPGASFEVDFTPVRTELSSWNPPP